MLLIYRPEGEPEQTFTFQPGKLMTPEAEALEECGGRSWDTFEEFGAKFLAGSLKARRAALWIMLKRSNPKLRFSDLVVRVEELSTRYDDDELERIRENIEEDDTLTDEERAEALAAVIGAQETSVAKAHPVVEEPEPEGKEQGGGDSTDSPSPEPGSEA